MEMKMDKKNLRDPDVEAVQLITAQVDGVLKQSMKDKVALNNEELVAMVCHLYENKEFILSEAGMGAPSAAKTSMEIDLICEGIDKCRNFAWNGDTIASAGLNLAEAAAPFFRKYGVRIKKLLRERQ
jgi:hypothetical protein